MSSFPLHVDRAARRPDVPAAMDPAMALGTLINQSGRQRMLSHRVVMYLGLIHDHLDPEARRPLLDEARRAIADFARGRALLVDGNADTGLPPLFSQRAKSILAARPKHVSEGLGGLALIDHFISRATDCAGRIEAREKNAYAALVALSSVTAGALLRLHNDLVSAFEADLVEAQTFAAQRNIDIRAIIEKTSGEIATLGLSIDMIALSAIVEAARAGEKGKSFAFLAKEIKDLGARTRSESAKIGAAVRDLCDGAA